MQFSDFIYPINLLMLTPSLSSSFSVISYDLRCSPTHICIGSGRVQALGLEGQFREGFKLYLFSVAKKKNIISYKRSLQKFFLSLISWLNKQEAAN